jgi:hypothetical protein
MKSHGYVTGQGGIKNPDEDTETYHSVYPTDCEDKERHVLGCSRR